MRDKKQKQSAKTPEQEALEKHVDDMMNPGRSEPRDDPAAQPAASDETTISAVTTPVQDEPGTAPQLSPKLRKQIAVSDASAEPLKIDKLDELTEKIAAEKPAKKKPAKKTATAKPPPTEQEQAAEPAPPEQPDITENGNDLDDAETDKAVDDIVAYEGDVMLAVADSTAAEHNREVQDQNAPKGHPVLSTLLWTMVAACVILIIVLVVLLVMGDSVASRLGL